MKKPSSKKINASSGGGGRGGLKGFLTKAGRSFLAGGLFAKDTSLWLGQIATKVGFAVATSSIVMLMPLVFEIARESQVREGREKED